MVVNDIDCLQTVWVVSIIVFTIWVLWVFFDFKNFKKLLEVIIFVVKRDFDLFRNAIF